LALMFASNPAASHTAWGKLYSRWLFDGVLYPEGRTHEDAATTYKLYHKATRIVHISSCYYCYSIRNDGIANSGFKIKSMDKLIAANEILDYVRINCPELQRHAECFLVASTLRLAADFSTEIIKKHPVEYKKVKNILLDRKYKKNVYLSFRHKFLLFLFKWCRPMFMAVWKRRISSANVKTAS